MKRRLVADQSGTDSKLLEAQNQAKLGDADVALKAAQTGKTTAETKVVEQQVAKTKADTKRRRCTTPPRRTPRRALPPKARRPSLPPTKQAGKSPAAQNL